MLIARYKYSGGSFEGIGEIFGCDTFNDYPSTYPPNLQYEPSIYNNDPNAYVTHETTGVRFYNSAVFKDVTNNRAYVILISNPTMYYYSHSYAEGRTDRYNGRGPTNRVYNDYSTGYAKSMDLSSSDNLATFESDLPIFTNYQDYYDYATSLHEPPDQNRSGGAGSGYIGNPLLSNKKMVGYNVPTSSAESTKTESVNEASETPVSGKPKIGNGFARIKFLRDVQVLTLEQITNGGQISGYTTISGDYTWNATPPWSEMDGRILLLKKYNGRPLEYDSNGGYFYFERKSGDSESNFYIPIPVRMKVTKITFDWMNSYRPTEWTRLGVKLEDTNQQAVDLVDFLDAQVMSDYASYSKEFSSPVYANYILFFAWDGEYKIKNFKIYGSV